MVLQSKEEIASDVKSELTKSMSSFGYAIIQTLVTDIEPAAKVKQAMNEINAATRMRYGDCCYECKKTKYGSNSS